MKARETAVDDPCSLPYDRGLNSWWVTPNTSIDGLTGFKHERAHNTVFELK